jgi:hypothetical protein
LPDQKSKDPYIIPVDVSGSSTENSINLNDLYLSLNGYSKSIVIIDACFSGGGRGQALIASRIAHPTPKDVNISGNTVGLFAASENQISLPLKTQQHGLFSYFLMKKNKESKGEININE